MYVPILYTIFMCKFTNQLTFMVTEHWYKSACINKTYYEQHSFDQYTQSNKRLIINHRYLKGSPHTNRHIWRNISLSYAYIAVLIICAKMYTMVIYVEYAFTL